MEQTSKVRLWKFDRRAETDLSLVLYHGKENVAQSDDLAQVVATIKRDGYDWPEYPLRRDTIHIGSKTYSIIAFKAKNPGS